MTVELIGMIAIAIAFVSLFAKPSFIVTVFLCATLLGSAAAFILESVGGLNISPAHFLLGFVAIKLLRDRRYRENMLMGISPGRPGFWLTLTLIYSLISAFFMPRLFVGQTAVFPMKILLNTVTIPLEPTMANLTQSIYFIGNSACFILLYGYASDPIGRRVLGNAALTCVVLNLVFVGLDLVTYWTGTTELLSFIRNSNYSIMAEAEMFGLKRIVGSFVEASSFASVTLGYFAFTLSLYLSGVRPRLTLVLSILTLCALIFSTSGTGYVGLGIFLFIFYIQLILSALRRPVTSQMMSFIICGPFVALLLLILVSLNESSSSYARDLLDTMIFSKMQTDSGIQRSAWNSQAIENFFDTFGFGVGNGSLRASSFLVAVLASLGMVGSITFGLFFFGVFFGRHGHLPGPLDEANRQAAKFVCLAWLITSSTSGALIDLGMPFFAFAALASVRRSTADERAMLHNHRSAAFWSSSALVKR